VDGTLDGMWLSDLFVSAKQDKFFVLLRRQSALLLEGARALERFTQGNDPEQADACGRIEHEADEVVTQLIEALRNSFITPFDRQDIYNLSEGLDDMLDYVNNAAREIRLFNVAPTPEMQDMSRILVDAAVEVDAAVTSLCAGSGEAQAHAANASHAENLMERTYRDALAKLFEGDDTRLMLKLREIYRHLSNSADRADAVGRLIGKIVVKAS